AGAYLESLTSQLGRSFGRPEVIETDTPKLWMGIDQALVCGLIVNELVTNALKHALGSRPTGRIGIALWDEDDGTRVLEVSDDGPGFIRSFAVGQRSLGLTLVTTLAKQLEGRLVVVPGPGTRIRIEFSVDRMVGEVAV
ncbi:MAG: sensor histidine kinase, partial [Deltaproteobacteria bacterium]|nr:sensor histidine kinase [Deltaproteobacteria bacterium]